MSSPTRRTSRALGRLLPWLLLCSLALPAAAADADHLIISEIVVRNSFDVEETGSPFIEITNPTDAAIDLSNTYLTDANAAGVAAYYNVVLEDPDTANPGGGSDGDFHAKFPDGCTLEAGDSLVISLAGSEEYDEAYGQFPDFELFEDEAVPDPVPELVEVFPGSINAGLGGGGNVPELAQAGESLMLYTWDGESANVADVDYLTWGSDTTVRIDKSGVTVESWTYQNDTAVASQDPAATTVHALGHSWARVSADEGTETLTGGNGITGHDETSENLSSTWTEAANQTPPDEPDELFPSAPMLSGLTSEPAAPYAGQTTALTATVATFGTVTGVTFSYTIDGGAASTLTGTDNGDGTWSATLPGQDEAAVIAWWVTATNNRGGEATLPVTPAFAPTWTVDAAPPPTEVAHKLLLTEICSGQNIYPFTGMEQIAMEFIEIHNPNAYDVDMSNYYLTDAINYYGSTQVYWNIANGPPHTQSSVGGGHYNDFTARFPDGYVIGANSTIVVSIGGSDWFYSVFAFYPDIELYEDGTTADDVPDMRPVFINPASDDEGDSIYTEGRYASSDDLPKGIPELEEYYGEPVILYHWLEGDALVTDIDIFIFGDEKTGNYRYGFDKTGVTMQGSTYEDDTEIDDQDWFTDTIPDGTLSYTRVDENEGAQATSGGNGVDGRDETSENWTVTFEKAAVTPGQFGEGPAVVIPAELEVEAATFNPREGETFPVRFKIGSEGECKIRIFDLEGRLIQTLFDSRFDETRPGFFTTVSWDGRDDEFERVPAGMYIVHMSMYDFTTGDESFKTAPVVVATWLSQ